MPAIDIAVPAERPGRAAPADLAERRQQMANAVAAGAWNTALPPAEIEIAGLRALRFRPAGAVKGHVLAIHGGGFRIGRPEFESFLAEALATLCQVEVLVPQYRLAPEAPFPAGLNDTLAALTALRAQVGDAPLVVCGDSAGGGLAASLGVLTSAQRDRAPRIDGLALLSPWLDLRVSAAAYADNAASDPLFSRESAEVAAELYLQGFDPAHPLVSPLLAPIAGFPPCLISVGTGEVLADDSRQFHVRLIDAGVASRLSEIAGMDHVAVVRGLDLPGARETLAEVTAFVDAIVDRRAAFQAAPDRVA